MHKSTLVAAGSVVLALSALGCSKPAPKAQPDPGKQYLQIVTPANAALVTMKMKLDSMGDFSSATLDEAVAPYIAALKNEDEALLRAAWPTKVQPDIQAMVTADKVVEAELGNAGAQTLFSMNEWQNQITQDLGRLHATVSVVRADLGLPPAS